MTVRRTISVLMLVGIAVVLGCAEDARELPTEPEYAKGGKPGPPDGKGGDDGDDGGGSDPQLVEYWVMPDADGETDLVHVVVDAPVDTAAGSVVYDHFFNGIQDDNYSPHYEFYYDGPGGYAAEVVNDTLYHADMAWSGERRADDNNVGSWFYRDFVATDIDGLGTDPFAFTVTLYKDGERLTTVTGKQPQGIVVGGEPIGAADADRTTLDGDGALGLHGDVAAVTSYGTYRGDPPVGAVYVSELAATGVSCRVKTERSGQGRNKTTTTVTEVTADVVIDLATNHDSIPDTWVEYHFADATSGAVSHRKTFTRDNTEDSPYSERVTLSIPGSHDPLEFEFQVDYVYPFGHGDSMEPRPGNNLVYDPTLNTNSGFDTRFTPAANPGDAPPVAATPTQTVDCR